MKNGELPIPNWQPQECKGQPISKVRQETKNTFNRYDLPRNKDPDHFVTHLHS
ncbi:MAG: hypothetical protein OXC62_03620 [Aestuariivita sp.]|nr:hypothetical protein [Aestuariivita sp.]